MAVFTLPISGFNTVLSFEESDGRYDFLVARSPSKAPKSAEPFTPGSAFYTLADRDGQPWTHSDRGRLAEFISKRNDLLRNIAEAKQIAAAHDRDAAKLEEDARKFKELANRSAESGGDSQREACAQRDNVAKYLRELEALGGAS